MKTYEGATGDIESVTPHNTTALRTGDNGYEVPTRAIWCGTVSAAQTLTVITAAGQTVTLTNPAQGVWHPIAATHIKSTGTDVTNIMAGW